MNSENSPVVRRASTVVGRRRSKKLEKGPQLHFTGSQIRTAREKMGCTQPEFVALLGRRGLERDDSWLSAIENGKNGIDPYDLFLVSLVSGYPIEWFIVPGFQPASRTAPRTRFEWEAMYPGDEERARSHHEVDEHFLRMEERFREMVGRPEPARDSNEHPRVGALYLTGY